MGMVKPIALSISSFDANSTSPQVFSFMANGGNQVVKNRLTIRRQDTNEVVYQHTVTSYTFEQSIVPSNIVGLENDYYYNFYFNTYDVNGEESENSNVIQFYCYAEPTFSFTNLPYNNIVNNNNYKFVVEYNQEQSELVDGVKFYLYDSFSNLISESEMYVNVGTVMPLRFEHTFNGFNNNETYKVEARVKTINGMMKSTGKHTFNVRYYFPEMFSLLDLENDCAKGCVKIKSNVIIADGITPINYTPPKYYPWFHVTEEKKAQYIKWNQIDEITPTTSSTVQNFDQVVISEWTEPLLDIHETDNWVKWEEGFSINKDLTFTLFVKPSNLGKFAVLGTEENGFVFNLIREFPYGSATPKDFIEVRGYKNGELKVLQRSNSMSLMNNFSYYMLWFRKVGNEYTVQTTVFEGKPNVMEYDNSNIEFEFFTDVLWNGETYPSGEPFVSMNEDIDDIFPLGRVYLTKGLYDHMDITDDVTTSYNTDKNDWTYYTKINCDFDDTIMGGNVDILFENIKSIKIKRRKQGTFDWITYKEIPINDYEDLSILVEDYLLPSNYNVDYAIVPTLEEGIEGNYIIKNITTSYKVTLIADADNVFNLDSITYGGNIKNIVIGTYQPLKGMYPIMQRNSELEYYSGSITSNMLGYNYSVGKFTDRVDIAKQTDDFCNFLNNTKAKIIKDWNGNIYLVRFMGSPSVSYNGGYGNGFAQVTASWVEQGKFDNQKDLYYGGLVNTLD